MRGSVDDDDRLKSKIVGFVEVLDRSGGEGE